MKLGLFLIVFLVIAVGGTILYIIDRGEKE